MAVAVSAIATAVGAFGTGAFLGLAATAVADTGIALTVVGAVTGDKGLMKAGAVMGLAGGIGSLANAAFGETAADVTAGSLASSGMSDAAATGSDMAGQAGADIAATTADTLATPVVGPGAVNGVNLPPLASETGNAIGATPTISGAGGNVDPVTGQVQPASTPVGNAPVNPAGTAPVSSVVDSTQTGLIGKAQLDGTNAFGANSAPGAYQLSQTAGTQASGIANSIKDLWGGLSDKQKAVVLQGALAVPGGILAQQNKARELALQQQRLTQTSYGTQVPSFGLINGARS